MASQHRYQYCFVRQSTTLGFGTKTILEPCLRGMGAQARPLRGQGEARGSHSGQLISAQPLVLVCYKVCVSGQGDHDLAISLFWGLKPPFSRNLLLTRRGFKTPQSAYLRIFGIITMFSGLRRDNQCIFTNYPVYYR